jgi:hypothetical protein
MDRDEEQAKKSFKVVDRRRFTPEGDVKEGVDLKAEPVRPAASPVEAPKAAAPAAPAASAKPQAPPKPMQPPASAEAENEVPPIPFASFLQSLAQQTLMLLGMMPTPSGTRELQLEAARDTIDVLETLRIKTKGNLDEEEAQFMEGLLYELKMAYVEVARRVSAASAPMGGPMGGGPMGKGPGR